ncbi:MAG TPA: redoxin domain-containing protein [Conexibacter sp.]|jgi:peroxiredoxin Q/BCP
MIETGEKAPQFTLPNQDGDNVSLSDYAGKTVVLYFYPKTTTTTSVWPPVVPLRARD